MASIEEELATETAGNAPGGTEPGAVASEAGAAANAGPAGGAGLIGSAGGWLRELLRRKTGPGELDAYAEHPANPTGDRHGARIARAVEGFTDGAAGLAVVDLAMGLWGLLKAQGKKAA